MADRGALPGWPRWLTREEAARYVGVSVDLFDDEVAAGTWPAPWKRGSKGGKYTWDRVALDRVSDSRLSSQSGLRDQGSPSDDVPDPAAENWREGLRGEAEGRRDQARPQDPKGRVGRRVLVHPSTPADAAGQAAHA